MVVKQISVFIENKEGRLKKAINAISNKNINIRALSLADTSKYGILRLIVSDNKLAIEALEEKGFIVRENEVIIVGVPDKPTGLNSVLEVFENNNLNIEYLYAFTSTKADEAIVVIRLENTENAVSILKENNINVFEKEDIERL